MISTAKNFSTHPTRGDDSGVREHAGGRGCPTIDATLMRKLIDPRQVGPGSLLRDSDPLTDPRPDPASGPSSWYRLCRVTPGDQTQYQWGNTMSDPERTREKRLRRMAARQGLRLEKSRRRDPRALDYGGYFIVEGPPRTPGGDNWRARVLLTGEYGIDLDAAEAFLLDSERAAARRAGETGDAGDHVH
jgi:hypothetical protein